MAGAEFIRNALDGLAGVRYSIEEIEQFLDAFGPLFDPANVGSSPIGRTLVQQVHLHDKPIGEVVFELTGRRVPELLSDLDEQVRVTVGEFDPYDVHLVAAAIERGADVICTNNHHDYSMDRIGPIEILGPWELGRSFGLWT